MKCSVKNCICPTAFAIRDFNPIDSAHAGRTNRKDHPLRDGPFCSSLMDNSNFILTVNEMQRNLNTHPWK